MAAMRSALWVALSPLLLCSRPAQSAACGGEPGENCYESRCCKDGSQCYQKNPGWAECMSSCTSDKNPGWDCFELFQWQLACTPYKGQECSHTGCCKDPGATCYAKNPWYAQCVDTYNVKATPVFTPPWGEPSLHYSSGEFGGRPMRTKSGRYCNSRFVPPDAPLHATDLNGQALPDVCIEGDRPFHVFLIGDWGGILPGHKGNELGANVAPADHTTFGSSKRSKQGVDSWAQQKVAETMKGRAAWAKPDYILNAGDAFYWGGIETHCGLPPFQHADTDQWRKIFEEMYRGPGLDGVQWLGVLGNHDYGGWQFTSGWDQIIGYTWSRGPASTGRWMMPAQYWTVKVHYPDFSVDYYFVDSNVFDTEEATNMDPHNICNMEKSGGSSASCGPQGPASAYDCPYWFKKLWQAQVGWLDYLLPRSTADWQIVVTHFPPTWGRNDWVRLSRHYGIDLIVSGHRHRQEVHYLDPHWIFYDGWPGLKVNFLDPTAWIVAGGGGGVTSEGYPDEAGNDDQYGFVDLTLSKHEILVEMISHGGQTRQSKRIYRWPAGIPRPNPKLVTPEGNEGGPEGGCGNRAHTFYLYRAQNQAEYSPENINAATLAGLLWYLHHEVVITCPRKFGITRIRRLKVTVKNTCELYKAKRTQFGPYVPMDSGQCTVPGCARNWELYGPVVGCQHIPFNTGIFAAYCNKPWQGTYEQCEYPQWFSLPGACPSLPYSAKTPECISQVPSGLCKGDTVDGTRDCTYKVESAGEINIDDLYEQPIGNIYDFCKWGKEYDNQTDTGTVRFWDGIYSPLQGQMRIETVLNRFGKKYPNMPERLGEVHCDYYQTDPRDYLVRTGSGFPRFPQPEFTI